MTTLFPVGHYLGVRSEEGRPVHTVRIGWRQHRLSEDAFATWVLAHGLPANGRAAWTRAELVDQAEQVEISTPADHLQALTSDGLVAAVDDAEAFARHHRMGVFFVGLGNTPEELGQFAIGLPGLGPAATLDPDSYELWQWGSIAPSLWHSCELRASVTSRDDQSVSPQDAVTEILADLRILISHGCAYLDVVDPEGVRG
ncbi:hypothetical protein ACFVWG_08140 [Kribbella sp. NPDC058245]|uniref:hypothetical protein n=1 Tax=Kribbella sp. NPDC058245 TaxID=3346399 RepID=UPI0036EFE4DC